MKLVMNNDWLIYNVNYKTTGSLRLGRFTGNLTKGKVFSGGKTIRVINNLINVRFI